MPEPMRATLRHITFLPVIAALGGCGWGEDDAAPPERDPAVASVIGGQLMIDPDLAASNEANAALTARHNYGLPPIEFPREAVNAAREEAAALVGGQDKLLAAPEPQEVAKPLPVSLEVSARARFEYFFESAGCAENLEFSAAWAARLPETLSIYPRSAVREAAGARGNSCDVRSVSFETPVPIEDVIVFYHALAKRNGYTIEHSQFAEKRVVSGEGRNSRYGLIATPHTGDRTHVDLVVLSDSPPS